LVSLYNLRASQIARVIGNDDYCSRQNHFAILIGEKEDKPVNEMYTSHGHECEKYGVAHVMIATQSLVVDCGSELLGSQFTMTEDYMSTDDTLVQLSCTPDGFIDEKNAVVEIKSPYFVQEDFDKYIKRYLPQVYFQQYLVRRNSRKNNADGTYFCIYQKGNTKLYYIPYNEDYINNYMLPKVDEFARYLLKGSLDKDFLTRRKSKESFIYNGEVQYNECI
jgi:hypothetical protein